MQHYTNEEFDEMLCLIIQEDFENNGARSFMTIHGFYELMSEEFNNAVIDRLDKMHNV